MHRTLLCMIALLSGKIVEREKGSLILDVQGVGYRVAVLSRLREQVQLGQELQLRIHHHITDAAEELYGFHQSEDLHYFGLLLTVPSVGPKTALGILEVAPPTVLEQALAEQDTTLLTKVSGVGKRTAERILVELREKVGAAGGGAVSGSIQHEAIEALVSIGYTTQQARDAVSKLPKEVTSVEEAVRRVLQGQPA